MLGISEQFSPEKKAVAQSKLMLLGPRSRLSAHCGNTKCGGCGLTWRRRHYAEVNPGQLRIKQERRPTRVLCLWAKA